MFLLLTVVSACAHFSSATSQYQEYLLFDFYSKLPVKEVKGYFDSDLVIKRHKAIGVGRYFFLVKNDHSEALQSMSLPPDAYNERVFPVQHVFALFSHFTDVPGDPVLPHLPDGNLTYLERTWNKAEMTYEELDAMISSYSKRIENYVQRTHSSVIHPFVPTGHLPIKYFLFMSMSDWEITKLTLDYSKNLGGPSAMKMSSVNIFNIK